MLGQFYRIYTSEFLCYLYVQDKTIQFVVNILEFLVYYEQSSLGKPHYFCITVMSSATVTFF
jgi:hypothetical protein